jgi:pimeloyl-ACP methyl ester carboxylesterase
VFIHGVGVADSYLSLADDPAVRDHYRTIRYRRRGYGGSSAADGHLSVSAHARDCRALLGALDVKKAHVVGHSYGGCVALQLAVEAPKVVATLVLFEPGLLAVPSGPQFFEAVGPIVERYSSGDRIGAVHAFIAAVGGPDWRSHLKSTVPGGLEQAENDAATLFESDLPSAGEWEFGSEEAGKINQPVLYVRGSDSLPLFGEGRDLLHSWLPRTEDAVLAGTTHLLQMERPADAAATLADFLKRHPVAG